MAHYNPEARAWRGRSYRKGGQNIRELRARVVADDIETLDVDPVNLDAPVSTPSTPARVVGA
jgi:hypothetical protein